MEKFSPTSVSESHFGTDLIESGPDSVLGAAELHLKAQVIESANPSEHLGRGTQQRSAPT